MMGKQKTIQESLFSYNVSLDARVRKDHVLRKIQKGTNRVRSQRSVALGSLGGRNL
jgi:hypothetical protein